MSPFFSILVPCCEVAPYVRECLESVNNQSFLDWECLVVVEASNDNTEQIVREFISDDTRFQLFTQPRSGSPSAPRNTGLGYAQGEYVIFLDGDDTIAENSLQKLHDKIAEHPDADLYPCAICNIDVNTKSCLGIIDNYPSNTPTELTGVEATILFERFGHIDPPCMVPMTIFRTSFLRQKNLMFIPKLRHEDVEFSSRALHYAQRVVPLHVPFYLYKVNRTGSITNTLEDQDDNDYAKALGMRLAFYASIARNPSSNSQEVISLSRMFIASLIWLEFFPHHGKFVSRQSRVAFLEEIFRNGFSDYNVLCENLALHRKINGRLIKLYVLIPILRRAIELFFIAYSKMSSLVRS